MSTYGKMKDDEPSCAGCIFALLAAVFWIFVGWAILAYVILNHRASNACPTSGVAHVSYEIPWYWTFNSHAIATCVNGDTHYISTKSGR